MKNTWTRLEDGTWGVKIAPSFAGDNHGLAYTITASDGRTSSVILTEEIRSFRVKGGTFMKVYRAVKTEAEYQAWLTTREGS